ncbi:MAG: glycoside hydrolase family 2 [Clostridia bacterium]|nr:glycoside hydrolase family 2 [Clostridia bacterium]
MLSEIPLSEYPRPQFKRDSYLSLNGKWDYSINTSPLKPTEFDGKILVPYSPETELSGVSKMVKKGDFLHYKRTFNLTSEFLKDRVLINFGACDQECKVFINDSFVGVHKGGYTPFSFDITKFLVKGENEIYLLVVDDASSDVYGRGKQVYKSGGIWYKPTSGLWQSVFIESVSENYIESLKLLPDYDNKKLKIIAVSSKNEDIELETVLNGKSNSFTFKSGEEFSLDVKDYKEWTPDTPELHPIYLKSGEDKVESYFGIRKFSKERINGKYYFTLNNKPFFFNGLLDQGYYEGSYTPKSNLDLFEEIKQVKALGFNMLRKHIKVEPMLWYYYCDVLGITVWQDMINGGKPYSPVRIALLPFIKVNLNDNNYKLMGRDNPLSREQYFKESTEMMNALYNVVSLALYSPFNEGWGQFDAIKVTEYFKTIDDSRLYDHASGWIDKGGGDVYSRHVYFRKCKPKNDKKRVLALTEFGGYSFPLENHTFCDKKFGYKMFQNGISYENAYINLYENEIIPLIENEGLSATVYTQLSDVEEEINGLFTFDRILKIDKEKLIKLNKKVSESFNDLFKD